MNPCCQKRTLSRAIGAVTLTMTVGALKLTSDDIFQGAADVLLEPRPGAGTTSTLKLAPVVLSVPPRVDVRKADLSIELQILAFHAQRQAVVRVALGEGAPANGSSGARQAMAI